MTTAPPRVTLKAVLPAGSALQLDLVGADELTGGVGVWNTLDRPRRRGAVEFGGVNAFTYVLPMLLDGMEATTGRDVSVEAGCRTLLSWASTVAKATKQPTVLRATGPLQTDSTVLWVISNLEWGEKVRNGAGQRVQQYVTVTLQQYLTATVRKSPAKKSRGRKGK